MKYILLIFIHVMPVFSIDYFPLNENNWWLYKTIRRTWTENDPMLISYEFIEVTSKTENSNYCAIPPDTITNDNFNCLFEYKYGAVKKIYSDSILINQVEQIEFEIYSSNNNIIIVDKGDIPRCENISNDSIWTLSTGIIHEQSHKGYDNCIENEYSSFTNIENNLIGKSDYYIPTNNLWGKDALPVDGARIIFENEVGFIKYEVGWMAISKYLIKSSLLNDDNPTNISNENHNLDSYTKHMNKDKYLINGKKFKINNRMNVYFIK